MCAWQGENQEPGSQAGLTGRAETAGSSFARSARLALQSCNEGSSRTAQDPNWDPLQRGQKTLENPQITSLYIHTDAKSCISKHHCTARGQLWD